MKKRNNVKLSIGLGVALLGSGLLLNKMAVETAKNIALQEAIQENAPAGSVVYFHAKDFPFSLDGALCINGRSEGAPVDIDGRKAVPTEISANIYLQSFMGRYTTDSMDRRYDGVRVLDKAPARPPETAGATLAQSTPDNG